MRHIDLLTTSFESLRRNRSRSFLTILGVVIGIAAIIIVMALGQGAQELILSEVQSIGAKTIAVAPGRHPNGLADVAAIFTDSLKPRDVELLEKKENVPHLAAIMPIVFGSQAASFEDNSYRPTIYGVTPLFSEIYSIFPERGESFTDDEVKNQAAVVVIGSKIKDELFGDSEAVGQKMRINNQSFRVIGLLGENGSSSFLNFDEAVIMPYTTAQRQVFCIKYYHRLVIQADEEDKVAQTVEDITATLRAAHGITDPSKDDFFVETQAQAMETVSAITDVLTLFLVAMAAISLLVGGIGIMNIMLVSVTERTKEIGLRKAIGATYREILSQFLAEAVILTVFGGLIGISVGLITSTLAAWILGQFVAGWEPQLPLGGIALGFAVATAVGLTFGLYPACHAARLDPIEALRYE
jgi:putative ABC transport system permease protein